jgi:hypothetical protein
MGLEQRLQAANPAPAAWVMLLDHLLWRGLHCNLQLHPDRRASHCVVHRSQQGLLVLLVLAHHG